MGTIGVEQDKCFFHADNSGRILHIGQDEVRSVYKIKFRTKRILALVNKIKDLSL